MSDPQTAPDELEQPEDLVAEEPRVLNIAPVLQGIAAQFEDHFGDKITTSDACNELTINASVEDLSDLFAFAKHEIRCNYLIDCSAVHWPLGSFAKETELATTGWPTQIDDQQGHFQVNYIVRSLTPPARFRITVRIPDVHPEVPSADPYWRSANVMEREVYDLMGINFIGHPNMIRIMMPDDWVGHPLRKDYGLGGVEVEFDGKTVPPADERDY